MAEGGGDMEMETFVDAGNTGDDAQETSFITGTDDDTVNLPEVPFGTLPPKERQGSFEERTQSMREEFRQSLRSVRRSWLMFSTRK